MAEQKNKAHEGIELGVKSTAAVDLEERAARDFEVPGQHRVNTGRLDPTGGEDVPAVEGNDQSAYRGVNPEYMNYANETDMPRDAEEGAEVKVLEMIDDSTPEPKFEEAVGSNAPTSTTTAPKAPAKPGVKTTSNS